VAVSSLQVPPFAHAGTHALAAQAGDKNGGRQMQIPVFASQDPLPLQDSGQ
jgi:hypothetical protein